MLEAVAGAVKGNDVGLVDNVVDLCRGDDRDTEYISPAGERQVRGQDWEACS